MRESWKQPGRWYLQKWPSRRAMASIRGKIRDRTDRRYARLPLEWAVEDLNRVLRGWGNYFRYGNSGRKFAQIDGYVNERLAILASAKHGLQRPQLGHPLQLRVGDPARRPSPHRNGETDACVCQPVNDVGEPCAGEPHARFDAAAGGNPGPVGTAAQSAHASRRPYQGAAVHDVAALLRLPQLSSDRLARSRTFEHPVTGFQVASVHSIALRSATRSRYFATDSRDACQTR